MTSPVNSNRDRFRRSKNRLRVSEKILGASGGVNSHQILAVSESTDRSPASELRVTSGAAAVAGHSVNLPPIKRDTAVARAKTQTTRAPTIGTLVQTYSKRYRSKSSTTAADTGEVSCI